MLCSGRNFSKFKIKEEIIAPSQGYVTIYARDYTGDTTNSTITNFRIANGETIYLVAQDGSSVIDYLTAIKTDDDKSEISIGRFPDGGDEIFIMSQSTPGKRNQKDMIKRSIDPSMMPNPYEK